MESCSNCKYRIMQGHFTNEHWHCSENDFSLEDVTYNLEGYICDEYLSDQSKRETVNIRKVDNNV